MAEQFIDSNLLNQVANSGDHAGDAIGMGLAQFLAARKHAEDQKQGALEAQLQAAKIKLLYDLGQAKVEAPLEKLSSQQAFQSEQKALDRDNTLKIASMRANTASTPKPKNLDASEVRDLADLKNLNDLATQANEVLFKQGKTDAIGPFAGKAAELGKTAIGSLIPGLREKAISASESHPLIRNIQGTIQKIRAGTSLTANEQKILEGFLPVPTDLPEALQNKLSGLQKYAQSLYNDKRTLAGQAGRDVSNVPGLSAPEAPKTDARAELRKKLGL